MVRRARLPLALALALGLGCSAEPSSDDAPEAPADPSPPVERSPDETEPVEPPPSAEQTGAPVAALHEQALRIDDAARAAAMLEQACDRAFTPSCVALADRYESGEGVEPDPARAAQLLEQACMDGSTIACDRLGH